MKHLSLGLLGLALLGAATWLLSEPDSFRAPGATRSTDVALIPGQETDAGLRDLAPPAESEGTRTAAPVVEEIPAPVLAAASVDTAPLGRSAIAVDISLKLASGAQSLKLIGKGKTLKNKACSVEARLPDGSLVERHLRTDEYGRATATIPRDSLGLGPDGKTTEVIVRLVEPGLQERFTLARARKVDGDLRLSAMLVLSGGATARGKVVDHLSGAPVPIDSLEIFGPGVRQRAFLGIYSKDRVQWTEDGRFEVHFSESAEVDFLARSLGHGSGSLSRVQLDVGQPPQELIIEVDGAASIVGRLVSSDGRVPLPTELRAVSVGLLGQKRALFGSRVSKKEAREGGGLLDATTTISADGRFRFGGIRPGEFTVLARVQLTDGVGYLDVCETVATDHPEPIEATLDLSYLVVSLVDVDGQPWVPKAVSEVQAKPANVAGRTAWPSAPSVRVWEAGPIGAPPILNSPGSNQLWLEDEALSQPHRRIYRVPEGRQYQVSVTGGPFPGTIHQVDVPEGEGAVLAQFQAEPSSGFGVLEVSVSGIDQRYLRENYRAEVLDAQTRSGVILSNLFSGEGPYRFDLPSGDYDVRIRGVAMHTSHGTMGPPDSSYVTHRVSITPGETTHQRFALRKGGKLEVTILCETPSTRAVARKGLHVNGSDPLFLFGRQASAGEPPRCVAKLALLHPSGGAEIVVRQAVGMLALSYPYRADSFPSGQAWTSASVSAGTFTLYVRLNDGREQRLPITIAEGATTPVTIAFD